MLRRAGVVAAVSRIPKDSAQTPEFIELGTVTRKRSTVSSYFCSCTQWSRVFAPRASGRPWPRFRTALAAPASLAGDTPSTPCPSELARGLRQAFQWVVSREHLNEIFYACAPSGRVSPIIETTQCSPLVDLLDCLTLKQSSGGMGCVVQGMSSPPILS